MTEPQVWTLIGVFAAAMFGTITIVATLFVNVVRSEIGSVRTEVRSEIGSVRTEVRSEIGGLRAEINARIDNLDRDVQALVKHTFGIDRG